MRSETPVALAVIRIVIVSRRASSKVAMLRTGADT